MKHRTPGFTIVELMIVIVTIGILAGIVILNVNGWKQRTQANQVQSDLKQAVSAMEDYRNTNDGYLVGLPPSFKASSGVTVTYTSGTATGYCINGKITATPTIAYYIQSTGRAPIPQAGTCV